VQQPVPGTPNTWHHDPLAFDPFPDMVLAHEIAHQWWGQAVGFKSYHDQWLSEGLAQHSALMFLASGKPGAADELIARMIDTIMPNLDEGPIALGPRLGHIDDRGAAYRALVYNKSAVVLDMLRRIVGDEAFAHGLRSFYEKFRYRKASTDDFRRSLESAAGRDLRQFFDQWIRGASVPELHVTTVVDQESGSADVRVQQTGDQIFELPIPFRVRYADGSTEPVSVMIRQADTHERLTFSRPVRRLELSKSLALARFR
jgi:aminopeptidase N